MVSKTYVPRTELSNIIGVSYSNIHLNMMMRKGEFPRAIFLSPKKKVWKVADLEKWVAQRTKEAQKKGAAA